MLRFLFRGRRGDFHFNFRFWYYLIILAIGAGVWMAVKKYYPRDAWDAIKATYMQGETEKSGE
jgi:2-keto-3-deoxy-6-phosphogluconate aldolase